MSGRGRALTLVAATVTVLALAMAPADAQTSAGTPGIVLDRSAVALGDKVLVKLEGWAVQESVSISLCGNAAARGSIDCDLTNSLGYGVSGASAVHAVLFRVTPPPMPCPCVIVATNTVQTKTATAAIDLVGHPTAPIVGNRSRPPLAIDVQARRADLGLLETLKSSIGGPTTYQLTIVLRNRTAGDLHGLRLTARAGRSSNDQARLITIKAPEVLAAGQAWTHKQKVTLAAPVVGTFVWKVAASGAGPTARAESSTRHVPMLLLLLILVLTADLGAMAGRWIHRRREEAKAQRVAETDARGNGADEPSLGLGDLVPDPSTVREPVSVAGQSAF